MTTGLIGQVFHYYVVNGMSILEAMGRQLLMTFDGVMLAVIIGLPLGILAQRFKKIGAGIITITNLLQIMPGLALMSLLMIVFGLGSRTVIITIFLYSLLPIIGNTLSGLLAVPKSLEDVGKGLGMTRWQILLKINLPMALPAIMTGIRNALIVSISIATLGAFIGGGGLGDLIIRGLNASDGGVIIIAGVLPTIIIAVLGDFLIQKLTQYLQV
ncbi:ABC transporter permease [Weissella diestrammenae]|uniref:ABC transporter permease n=1 Tax=Weissella diestrammenae TaxID=1162633 RepID=A0A7G9T537_9LACO|nr:ABC transporter permease [Weissella diestrammenae]MCM0583066.1 ABC transporter permease [Weissella diestrammenae]QNN75212.1 ABC transporter permease [Weissella diestrammenae]